MTLHTNSSTGGNPGKEFEQRVADLLNGLAEAHPDLVEIREQPRITLHIELLYLIPDFELIYRLPHQEDHRLIECQDRNESTQGIVRKIKDIKTHSKRNQFIFVYANPDFLTDPVRRHLESDGIVHYHLAEFADFLAMLNATLKLTAPLSSANDAGELPKYFEENPDLKPPPTITACQQKKNPPSIEPTANLGGVGEESHSHHSRMNLQMKSMPVEFQRTRRVERSPTISNIVDPKVAEDLVTRARLMIRLKTFIEEKNLTYEEAAKHLGVKQSHISALKEGRIEQFSIEKLEYMLARAGLR